MKYRIEVKMRKGWKPGKTEHPTKQAAEEHMDKLISMGHPKTCIRVRPVGEDF